MFRAFSLALTVVLCTCGWSKAQAEQPLHVTYENGKFTLEPPVEFSSRFFTYRQSVIELPKFSTIVTFSTVACTVFPQCRRIVGDKVLRFGKMLAH
jgi:hypothetical protein